MLFRSFWTIGYYLNQWGGWRQTLLAFALFDLAVCVPLNWVGLARRRDSPSGVDGAAPPKTPSPDGPALTGRARGNGVVLFALVMSLNGFVFGVVSLQLVPLLEASGLAAATAVWIASLKGFAQFAGRVVEIVFGRKLQAITVGRIAVGALPFSLILLLFANGNFAALLAFTLLMGASQGVITIVRGAVPLALFGPKEYGTVLGVIAAPVLIVNAVSPTIFALLIDRWGWNTAQLTLLACAGASWLAMELMSRWYKKCTPQAGPAQYCCKRLGTLLLGPTKRGHRRTKHPLGGGFTHRHRRRMPDAPLRSDGVELLGHRLDTTNLRHMVLSAHIVRDRRRRDERTRSALTKGLHQRAIIKFTNDARLYAIVLEPLLHAPAYRHRFAR